MHKHHIHATLFMTTFLCTMHTHSTNLKEMLNNKNSAKLLRLMEKKTSKPVIEITHSTENDSSLELTQQKLGLDKWPVITGAGSIALALGMVHLFLQDKAPMAVLYSALTAMMSYITYDRIQYNLRQSDGRRYLHTPVDKARIILVKQNNGTSIAQYQKSLATHWSAFYLNMSDKKQLNLEKEQIEQLAQKIAAHHDATMEQKNLFASQLFKDIAAQQD